MDYRDSVDLSDSHIQRGSGGGGRGGRMALGGGVGGVVLMLLVVFVGPSLGINVSDLLGSGGSQNTRGRRGRATVLSIAGRRTSTSTPTASVAGRSTTRWSRITGQRPSPTTATGR